MKTTLRILVAAGAALFSISAHAQSFPTKQPITIVTAFGPGSASDTIARVIAQPLSIAFKQSVIVEAKPGANGALSALYTARAAPDGYTLLLSTNSPQSAVPFMMKNVPYDAVKDFTAVSRLGSFTLILVIHPDIPAKTVKELIAYGKANPGKLTFASGNSSGVVAGETLKHWAGIDMLHVPYKSSPQALNDLLAGRVSMMFTDLTTGLPHINAGTLRALAVTRIKRSSLFASLPTMDEAGVTGFDMDSWAGIVGPAHIPPDVVAKLSATLRPIIDSPEVKTVLGRVGFEAFSSSPEELDSFIKVQLNAWGKMIKDAGIQAD